MKTSRNSLTEDQMRKVLGQILLDSSESLSNDITKAVRSVVNAYIIDFRKKFLDNMEFATPKTASKCSGIPLITIYTWITKGVLIAYSIDKSSYISMTQLYSIPYKPHSKDSIVDSVSDSAIEVIPEYQPR